MYNWTRGCDFVKANETECEPGSAFNFQEFYYCTLDSSLGPSKAYLFVPLALLILGIAMYNLASTADAYLSPALETISDKFSCSESLAGVTLLALGNGGPDVFSAIAAGGTTESKINLLVSGLFGSALFISTVVMAMTTKASLNEGTITVTKGFFIRDSLFMQLTSIYMIVVCLGLQKFDLIISLSFIGIYAIFVVVVVIQSKIHN